MRVLIIDQCSGRKNLPDDCRELEETEIDELDIQKLLQTGDIVSRRARRLYDGRQQRKITEAVDQLRAVDVDVDRCFVSAGFGLVDEDQELPAYDVTFRNESHARERGEKLGLYSSVSNAAREQFDIVFFPLGEQYYEAMNVDQIVPELAEDALVVVFNREELDSHNENVLSLPANTETGSKYGGGVIGVKGSYLQNFAENVASGSTVESLDDIKQLCTTTPTEQTGFDRFENK